MNADTKKDGCEFCSECGECLEHDYCICCLVCGSPFCKDSSHRVEVELDG